MKLDENDYLAKFHEDSTKKCGFYTNDQFLNVTNFF